LCLGTIRRGFPVTALCATGQVIGGQVKVRAEYARGGGLDPHACSFFYLRPAALASGLRLPLRPEQEPILVSANTSESEAPRSVEIGDRATRLAGGWAVEIPGSSPGTHGQALVSGPTALIDLLHQVILDAHLLDLVELSFDPVDMRFLVLQYGIHEFP